MISKPITSYSIIVNDFTKSLSLFILRYTKFTSLPLLQQHYKASLKTTNIYIMRSFLVLMSIACYVHTTKSVAKSEYKSVTIAHQSTYDTLEKVQDTSSKKGVCITKKAHSSQANWSMKVASVKPYWHYSWGAEITEYDVKGVDFVPMLWGRFKKPKLDLVSNYIKDKKVKYVLGFNEPDAKKQANMTVKEAIKMWATLQSLGVPLGSPAPVDARKQAKDPWLAKFMKKAEGLNYRVDFICVHSHGGNNAKYFLDKIDQIYKDYGKPIWITELSVSDWKATSVNNNRFSKKDVLKFMQEVLPALDKRAYVHRYAWYSPAIDNVAGTSSALFDAKGKLTTLGEYYANYKPNLNAGNGSVIPKSK